LVICIRRVRSSATTGHDSDDDTPLKRTYTMRDGKNTEERKRMKDEREK